MGLSRIAMLSTPSDGIDDVLHVCSLSMTTDARYVTQGNYKRSKCEIRGCRRDENPTFSSWTFSAGTAIQPYCMLFKCIIAAKLRTIQSRTRVLFRRWLSGIAVLVMAVLLLILRC